MILDGYWKRELFRNKLSLKLWLKLSAIGFRNYADHKVNKAILYSAVIMRKMFEDEKTAETQVKNSNAMMPPLRLLKYKVKVNVYPFTGDKNLISEYPWPDDYDFKNAVTEEIELNKLCNQILHAYSWAVVRRKGSKRISSVMFSSDRTKTELLYRLDPREFIKAIDYFVEHGHI